mmetsp:Transcript_66847/g.186808  ORF Transcript_66847/g.186808 Transcript_66847/m.186808 type:complete len:240 (-) Transcript_66847:130-849(-)
MPSPSSRSFSAAAILSPTWTPCSATWAASALQLGEAPALAPPAPLEDEEIPSATRSSTQASATWAWGEEVALAPSCLARTAEVVVRRLARRRQPASSTASASQSHRPRSESQTAPSRRGRRSRAGMVRQEAAPTECWEMDSAAWAASVASAASAVASVKEDSASEVQPDVGIDVKLGVAVCSQEHVMRMQIVADGSFSRSLGDRRSPPPCYSCPLHRNRSRPPLHSWIAHTAPVHPPLC